MEECKAWRSLLACGWCCGWECVELSLHLCMCSHGAWLSTETILLLFYTTHCMRTIPLLDIQFINRLIIGTVLFIGFLPGWPKSVKRIQTLCAMKIKIHALLEDSAFRMMAKDTMEHRTTFLTKWLQCQVIFNSSICMVLCHLGYMVPWTLCLERLPEPHLANCPHHITISEEFIQLLDTFQITSEDTLVTFNIIHLFTTVPIGHTLILLSW